MRPPAGLQGHRPGDADGKHKDTMQSKSWFAVGALVAITAMQGGSFTALAEDKPAEKKGWETTAALGATLARGNSETFLGTLTLDSKRKWEHDEAAFGVAAGFGDSTTTGVYTKNTQFVRGFGQYNRLFNERFFGGLRTDGEYDAIAGVDYRARISPLAGYYLIKKPETTFTVEVGPSLVFEHLAATDSRSYWAARAGERFDHKLTATTKVWQMAEYIPDVEDFSNKYLVNVEVGIDAAITKQLSLRAVVQDSYNNEPAAGRKQNDIRLITGVAYKF